MNLHIIYSSVKLYPLTVSISLLIRDAGHWTTIYRLDHGFNSKRGMMHSESLQKSRLTLKATEQWRMPKCCVISAIQPNIGDSGQFWGWAAGCNLPCHQENLHLLPTL